MSFRVDYLKVNKNNVTISKTIDRRHMCCCHHSPRNRPRLDIVNEYSKSVRMLRSPSNLSIRSRNAIETVHTTSVIDLLSTSALGKQINKGKKKKKKGKKKK